jgi:hypothetical protein
MLVNAAAGSAKNIVPNRLMHRSNWADGRAETPAPLPLPASHSRLYGPHSIRNLGASLDELIVNTIHDPRGVVSTSRLHACASGVVVGGSHSDR